MKNKITPGYIFTICFVFLFICFSCYKENDFGDEPDEEPVNNLIISPSSVSFGYYQDTKQVLVKNTGSASFNWSIKEKEDFLNLSLESGTLEAGDSVSLTLVLDRTNLDVGDLSFFPVFINSDGFEASLQVQTKHFIEEKWLLDIILADAEYHPEHNFIAAISSPVEEKFYLIHPETQEINSLSLYKSPTCVSIEPSGKYAAVGSPGAVFYINLETLEIEKIYNANLTPHDIVLAGNDWVYLFPDDSGFGFKWIHCLYLPTGGISPHEGNNIKSRTKAKLHPSGNFIYGADNGISPSDFEKYDISEGIAQYLYDSPYHTEYNFNGDIWISEDGKRLYAPSKNIFRATQTPNTDITFIKAFPGELYQRIVWMAESEASPKIYAIYATTENGFPFNHPERTIRKFNIHHEYRGFERIPNFLIPDGNGSGDLYPGNGRYCFLNSEGTELYVLATAEVKDEYMDHWALVTFEVD